MTEPTPSGADLARVALAAARKAAKNAPAPKTTRRRRASRRGDGRDPIALGAAITSLMDDRAWETPAAGGNILDQWPTIAPELVGKVAAEGFDPATGTLHLRPGSPAYATQLRMFGGQMVDRINAKTGRPTVRAIRVLPPGALPRPATAPALEDGDPQPPRQPAEPRTRAQASAGYHAALEAALAGREHADPADPHQADRDRLFADIRGALREPADAQAVTEQTAPQGGGNDADTIRHAAIVRARAERAGCIPAVPTVFQRTA